MKKYTENIFLFIALSAIFLPALFAFSQAVTPEPCPTGTPLTTTIICDIDPAIARPGDTVQISGVNLTSSIQLYNSAGSAINVSGTVNATADLVTFTVPATIPLGDYTIGVVGSGVIATSNEVLTIMLTLPSGMEPPLQPFSDPEGVAIPDATPFQEIIKYVFDYSVIIVGMAVFIVILSAGFLWLTSAANPGNISRAKKMIYNAILGGILLLSSYVILATINPDLVGDTLEIDRIVEPSSVTSSGISRLLAVEELGAASAITSGCSIATETRDFTAVECSAEEATASGLPLDPVIEVSDLGANQQVSATVLQTAGNTGAGRRIVILDTGYNRTHPELSSSYLGGWDFVNNDNDPSDDHSSGVGAPGHGSHVAGIITADGADAQARGVAPGAQIIAGKVLDSQGKGYWSTMVEAIYWAINGPDGIYGTADDFNPDAINISMGGGVYNSICDNNDDTTKLLLSALQYVRAHGVLPIIAAGNKSSGISMPGCISEAFTVGAVNSSDGIAGFSGRGPALDIVAPGVNIYSTLLSGSYGRKSGTSMATPVVSGIAALLKATNPSLTVTQLEQAITSTACDLGPAGRDNTYGWGRITAVPGSCTPPPPPPPPAGASGSISSSIASCTKGVLTTNPNCNIALTYQTANVPLPNSIIVKGNGVELQRTDCSAPSCNGTFNYNNPRADNYQFSIHLSSNRNQLAKVNVYIYTVGSMNADFTTCTTGNVANPNCDVTLSINASSVYPARPLIKKDGYNWRLISCSSPSCIETITDTATTVGIHTYTLHDSSDGSRLDRVILTINPGTPPPPPPITYFATLCSGVNYTGTCESFSNSDIDLSNNTIGDNNARSIRGEATVCADTNYGGVCESFMVDTPDLGARFIGAGTVSSVRRIAIGGRRVTFCSEINFGGVCETITNDAFDTYGWDPDLSNNPIGNDTISSMRLESSDIRLCTDVNFGGLCQNFRGSAIFPGIYPDLRYHPVGDNTTSSYISF